MVTPFSARVEIKFIDLMNGMIFRVIDHPQPLGLLVHRQRLSVLHLAASPLQVRPSSERRLVDL